jgi:hypothetical protein
VIFPGALLTLFALFYLTDLPVWRKVNTQDRFDTSDTNTFDGQRAIMTAEVAIINRSAVTLATDSAVTLTVRGSEKIYNSADKLFELSDRDPMGIMVYNNLEYMGISLEVAIKQFRLKRRHFASVVEAAEQFFEYLLEELAPGEALQRQHAKAILYRHFLDIRAQFSRRLSREYEETKGKVRNVDLSSLFTQLVCGRISEAESAGPSKCFSDTSESAIAAFYSDTLYALAGEVFGDFSLEEEHKALLMRMGVLLLHRDIFSDSFTGLIFAGFGESEIFPSLVAYKVDGVILGKLKKLVTDREMTSRSEVTGKILPFAQREMVDRFLYGIDPEFEREIEQYIEAVAQVTGQSIAEALPKRRSKASIQKLNESVAIATDKALTRWRDEMVPAYKRLFARDVQNVIFLMPKQELAFLAQELVNLTSVKRKFSSVIESVGGPIDVAVISRIDGFVWVRRKHYFEPNLNPRYFQRKFGTIQA